MSSRPVTGLTALPPPEGELGPLVLSRGGEGWVCDTPSCPCGGPSQLSLPREPSRGKWPVLPRGRQLRAGWLATGQRCLSPLPSAPKL